MPTIFFFVSLPHTLLLPAPGPSAVTGVRPSPPPPPVLPQLTKLYATAGVQLTGGYFSIFHPTELLFRRSALLIEGFDCGSNTKLV